MIHSQLWRANEPKVKAVHLWRPRRSRFGELVQWDTREHDWLEGRSQKVYRIALNDATSARHDRGEQETARKLPGEVRAAAGILYGQTKYLSNGGEAQTG